MHTLDAWRRRVAGSRQEIVPVEIVEEGVFRLGTVQAGSMGQRGQFRIVLSHGLSIDVEFGFDATELRRLIAALDSVPLRGVLRQPM